MSLVSAQYAKCQTQPQMRNVCCIALNLLPTNKFSRTPSNSNGMPEWWWDHFSTICHRNNNNNNIVYQLMVLSPALTLTLPHQLFAAHKLSYLTWQDSQEMTSLMTVVWFAPVTRKWRFHICYKIRWLGKYVQCSEEPTLSHTYQNFY